MGHRGTGRTTSGSIVVVLSRHKAPTSFPDTPGPVNAGRQGQHPEDTISLFTSDSLDHTHWGQVFAYELFYL